MLHTIGIIAFLTGLGLSAFVVILIERRNTPIRREMIASTGGDIVIGENAWELRIFLSLPFIYPLINRFFDLVLGLEHPMEIWLIMTGASFAIAAGISWLMSKFFKPTIVSFWQNGGVLYPGSKSEFWFNWDDIAAAGTDGLGCIWMIDRDGKTHAPNSMFGRDRVLEWLIRKCPDRFYLKTNPKTHIVTERG